MAKRYEMPEDEKGLFVLAMEALVALAELFLVSCLLWAGVCLLL